MNGKRKPRQPRWLPTGNTALIAINRACKLTRHEIDHIIGHTKLGMTALREGRATDFHWTLVAGMINAALHIQLQGVVKIPGDYLANAEAAANAVRERAEASGTWKSPTLYAREIEALQVCIELHEFQLSQLSQGEALAAIGHAEANVKRLGGQVLPREEVAKLFASA